MTPPSGLQLDLLTACQRIRQVWEEDGGGTSLGELLMQRLFTCDLPRLEGYLTAETLAWADEQDLPAPGKAEGCSCTCSNCSGCLGS